MHDFKTCLLLHFIRGQYQQVLWLAVLQEIDEPNLFVLAIGDLASEQFKHVLAVIIADNAVLVLVSDYKSLLFKLKSVSESNKPALRETKVFDIHYIVCQLKSQMLFFVGFAIKDIGGSQLGLYHVLKVSGLL